MGLTADPLCTHHCARKRKHSLNEAAGSWDLAPDMGEAKLLSVTIRHDSGPTTSSTLDTTGTIPVITYSVPLPPK
jgi:hypothetical protein